MNLVCIQCPMGCHLTVEEVNGEIVVTGNTCDRGKQYAINELTDPKRVLTTTVAFAGNTHKRLPVISSDSLPKDRIFDCVNALKDVKVDHPVRIKDVIVKDILGLGVDIIASRSLED